MNICFVQKQPFPYFGVMSLAGALKPAGHHCEAVITGLENDAIATVAACHPDLIAVSLLSSEHVWLQDLARQLKTALPNVPLVVGGIHAILYPHAILAIPAVDYVCTGDGEELLPALCRALTSGAALAEIPGLAYRAGTNVTVNPRAPLHSDLDAYDEDRSVYYRRYDTLRRDELKQFIASRGCPYVCAFCFNEQLHALFGAAKSVRLKSPQQLVREIKSVRETAGIKSVFFADDLFAANKNWLREFAALYRSEIAIPFMCLVRADRIDREIVSLLHSAGCHTVSFGIESGNEQLRTRLLHKQITDEQIRRCAKLLKEYGVKIQTSNMFCLPDETFADACMTIRLNIEIGADFVFTPLFMPFPGTKLAAYCQQQGYLPADFDLNHLPQSFMRHSVLNLPQRVQIENLQRIAYFVLKWPALFPRMQGLLRHLRVTWPFIPFLYLGTLLRYKEERRLSWTATIKLLWRFRQSR